MILANGHVIDLSPSRQSAYFHAACLSLGCLGVICRITLSVLPKFQLLQTVSKDKLSMILSRWGDIPSEADYLRLHWYPHTDVVTVWKAKGTTVMPSNCITSLVIDMRFNDKI